MFSSRVRGWARRLAGGMRTALVAVAALAPGTAWAAGARRDVDPQGAIAPPARAGNGHSGLPSRPDAGSSRPPAAPPRADAGDDGIGVVGRRITLNGRASTPAGRIGFRWIQVEGPPVRIRLDEGDLLTFVPEAPGVYRFALVVAEGGVISEPDFATVRVVAEAAEIRRAPDAGRSRLTDGSAPTGPEQAARAALASLEEGPASATALAAAFEEIAGRIDLYATYADILQGSSSRLGPVLPADPARREAWNQRLFIPLTRWLIDDLRVMGLDLSRPEGLAVPLSAGHRARLAEAFRAMARGFRSASPPEDPVRSPEPTP